MHSVTVSTHLPANADEVWSNIGDPGAISGWHPAIAESSLDDASRRCTLANGAEIMEHIDEVDEASRSYSYRILESPLPLEDYRSRITVNEAAGGCTVEWTASFHVTDGPAEDTVGMIKGVYDAGMGALRERFAG